MEEDSDEEWNELMKIDMDDVFMEEVAIWSHHANQANEEIY
jgi:hypothetical protein